MPERFSVSSNFPNPFNASTTISFALPEARDVRVTVYNVLGHQVARLVDGRLAAGVHEVFWIAGDQSSGIYVCRVTAGREERAVTMVLMK